LRIKTATGAAQLPQATSNSLRGRQSVSRASRQAQFPYDDRYVTTTECTPAHALHCQCPPNAHLPMPCTANAEASVMRSPEKKTVHAEMKKTTEN